MAHLKPDQLRHEGRIVWLRDIGPLDCVREDLWQVPFRRRAPRKGALPGRLVGYAELRPDAPGDNGRFWRRVFWLKEYDRDSGAGPYLRVGAPCEAVDPRTVAPGVPGELTERAWRGAAA